MLPVVLHAVLAYIPTARFEFPLGQMRFRNGHTKVLDPAHPEELAHNIEQAYFSTAVKSKVI